MYNVLVYVHPVKGLSYYNTIPQIKTLMVYAFQIGGVLKFLFFNAMEEIADTLETGNKQFNKFVLTTMVTTIGFQDCVFSVKTY